MDLGNIFGGSGMGLGKIKKNFAGSWEGLGWILEWFWVDLGKIVGGSGVDHWRV